jgi:hypothetical protein
MSNNQVNMFFINEQVKKLYTSFMAKSQNDEQKMLAKLDEQIAKADEQLASDLKKNKDNMMNLIKMRQASESGHLFTIEGAYEALGGADGANINLAFEDGEKITRRDPKNYPNSILIYTPAGNPKEKPKMFAVVHEDDSVFVVSKTAKAKLEEAITALIPESEEENNTNNQAENGEEEETLQLEDEGQTNEPEEDEVQPAKPEEVKNKRGPKKAAKAETTAEKPKSNAGEKAKTASKKPASKPKPKAEPKQAENGEDDEESEEEELEEMNGYKIGQVVKIDGMTKYGKKGRYAMIDGHFTKKTVRCYILISNNNQYSKNWTPQTPFSTCKYEHLNHISDTEAEKAINLYKSWREEFGDSPFNEEDPEYEGKTILDDESLPKFWESNDMFSYLPTEDMEEEEPVKPAKAKPTPKATGKRKNVEDEPVAPKKGSKKSKTDFDHFMEQFANLPASDAMRAMDIIKLAMPDHF